MKDGKSGEVIASRLEVVDEVGTADDGDPISSCIVMPSEAPATTRSATKLTQNQQTFFEVLARSGVPLIWDEWIEQAKAAGMIFQRRATYWDLRTALQKKGLVYEGANGWRPK